jgi:hypothetical protein
VTLFPISAQHRDVLLHLAGCLCVGRTRGHVHRLTITTWQDVGISPEASSRGEMGIRWTSPVNIHINDHILELFTDIGCTGHTRIPSCFMMNRLSPPHAYTKSPVQAHEEPEQDPPAAYIGTRLSLRVRYSVFFHFGKFGRRVGRRTLEVASSAGTRIRIRPTPL